jgi:hypothetical protein
MRHTFFRLKSMLYKALYEERPALELTLKQMNQIQTELMMVHATSQQLPQHDS